MRPRIPPSLLLAGLLALVPRAGEAQSDSYYSVRPGDKVTIEVFSSAGQRIDVVVGERVVDRNGEIHLPFVGTIRAQGLDENALRNLLIETYGAFYPDPVVNVRVELRVNITGAVPRPGQYYLHPTATIIDAITLAGGTNPEYSVTAQVYPANAKEVRLLRDGQRYTLNFHPNEATPETLNLRIQSGDWIHVPTRTQSFIRDQIMLWGGVVSFISGVTTLILVATR